MKITTIKITNFRSIESIHLPDLAPSVVLFGDNGAGKTSIIHAVQWALFGFTPLTTRDGKRASPLVREGASTAEIEVTLEPAGVTVLAQIKSRGQDWSAIDRNGEIVAKNRDELWRHALKMDQKHAVASGFPDLFLDADSLADALGQYSDGAISTETVLLHAGVRRRPLQDFLSAQNFGDIQSIHDLDRLGKYTYEARALNKKQRQANEVAAESDGIKFVTQPRDRDGNLRSPGDKVALDKGMAHATISRDKLLAAKGVAESVESREDLQVERDNLAANRETLATKYVDTLDPLSAATNEVTRITELINDIERNDAARKAKAVTIESQERSIAKQIEAADTDVCPTCNRKIGKAALTKILAPLEAEQKRLQSELEDGKQEGARALEVLKNTHEQLSEARKNHEDAVAKSNQAEQNTIDLERNIEDIDRRLAATNGHGAVEDIAAKILEIEEKLDRGTKLIEALEKYGDRLSFERAQEELTEKINFLDWACLQYKDGAAKKELLGSGMGEFLERVNIALGRFNLTLAIDIDGKKVTPILNGRPAILSSAGERKLAALVIAMAFADSGAPVFIDDLNELDQVNRRTVLGMLREHTESTILAAAAWQQLQEKTDKHALACVLDPVTVVWIDHGRAES